MVEVPLHLGEMAGTPSVSNIHQALADAYAGEAFIEVPSLAECGQVTTLDPEGLNDTNRMRLYVFGNESRRQARLVAVLDNLGKGASGAAVQNLNLMLGLTETAGLA